MHVIVKFSNSHIFSFEGMVFYLVAIASSYLLNAYMLATFNFVITRFR